MIIREEGRRVGNPQQSCIGPLPGGAADPDPEWAEYVAWLDREIAAGRDTQPETWAAEAGEPWDPESIGPESANPVRPRFGQGDEADVLPPGPFLVGFTEEATCEPGRLSDNELIGVLQATRRSSPLQPTPATGSTTRST